MNARFCRRILLIPPAPAVFDQRVIDVRAVGEQHISKRTSVLALAVCLEPDLFPDGEFRGGVLGLLAVSPLSGQSIPLRRMRSTWWPFRTSIVSPSRTPTMGPVNSVASTELVTRSVRKTVQRQRMDRMLAGVSRHGEGTTIGRSVGRGFGRG